jgi:putative DNA primase/helicase
MAGVATIARNLGGERGGANWRAPCPLGCGYPLSLAAGEDGRLLAHCFGGCDYREIEVALVEYGLLDDDEFEASQSVAVCQPRRDPADEARRIDYARRLYESAAPDPLIDTYLSLRGITIRSSVLRFSPRYRHRLGVELPAMVAPVVDVDGEQIGIHATFIKADGSGQAFPKPRKGEPDFRRQCNGVIRGGAIRLASHDPNQALLVAEGIETTASAMQISGFPGWSTVYAGGLLTVALPPEVRRIVIAADRDVTGTGQRNAVDAGRRWRAEGRAVRIVLPETVGQDINDVLAARWR